jgi:hypothetical protein
MGREVTHQWLARWCGADGRGLMSPFAAWSQTVRQGDSQTSLCPLMFLCLRRCWCVVSVVLKLQWKCYILGLHVFDACRAVCLFWFILAFFRFFWFYVLLFRVFWPNYLPVSFFSCFCIKCSASCLYVCLFASLKPLLFLLLDRRWVWLLNYWPQKSKDMFYWCFIDVFKEKDNAIFGHFLSQCGFAKSCCISASGSSWLAQAGSPGRSRWAMVTVPNRPPRWLVNEMLNGMLNGSWWDGLWFTTWGMTWYDLPINHPYHPM